MRAFFPWPHGRRGRQGTGQAGTVSLAIPPASLGFWIERLLSHGIKYEGPARRFDEQVLSFADPDGLLLELVASSRAAGIPAWEDATGHPPSPASRYVGKNERGLAASVFLLLRHPSDFRIG